MRVLFANPPGYGGPDYDDHLCTELGKLGVDVELVTSRFRFGDVPDAARLPAQRAVLPAQLPRSSAARGCGSR